MLSHLNIGIGFVTGRSNVCNVINSYYKYIKEQVQSFYRNTNITFYILYDTEYQGTKKEDFYKLKPEVFTEPNITVTYITPEVITDMKDKIKEKYKLTDEEVNLIIGRGHAKGRNTVLYKAYSDNMNYLYFWDDDEYPVACLKNEDGTVSWKMQDNVVKHIEAMENYDADVTIGYHCGYISPIPYMKFDKPEDEQAISDFIEGISNEIVTWESVKEKYENNKGVTYADPKIADGEGLFEIEAANGGKFVAGSTLCINLSHVDKIPAFFNPEGARGEDTFFSLGLTDCKVLRVPAYHFHDGFLKYTEIQDGEFPDELRLIKSNESSVDKRFYKCCLGWIKYKPLLMYLLERDTYKKDIQKVYKKLEASIDKINSIYENCDFTNVYKALEECDKNVEEDYATLEKTNNVWNELKTKLYTK